MNGPAILPPAQDMGFPSSHPTAADRAQPEVRQRRGKRLVVAGWVVAMLGVGLYCAASFAADASLDLPDMLRAFPVARAGLALIGFGTLVWAIGSVMHLRAALDAGEDAADGTGSPGRRDA